MTTLDTLRGRLVILGADRTAHSGRTLMEHLTSTARLLESWGCDEAVCIAGMFHSIYGTNAFGFSGLDPGDREQLRDIIGPRAEALVFLFCTGDRPAALVDALQTGRWRNRLTGQSISLPPDVVSDLIEIECANLLEQQCGHRFLVSLTATAATAAGPLKPKIAQAVRHFLNHVSGPFPSTLASRGTTMHADVAAPPALDDTDLFAQRGYLVMRNLLSRRLLDIALRYYLSHLKVEGYYSTNERTRALNRYADALGEALFPEIQPLIEARIGKKLIPTYSFARIYTTESRLTPHVDRGACEISATLTVGFKCPSLWPIFLRHDGSDLAIELDVGDALIYRGMDLSHWREPLTSGFWCQLFFHFVEADGPMTAHAFDGRKALGPQTGASED